MRRFKVEVALFSARPRLGGLSLTTGVNTNRSYMLDGLCATWAGPLIAVVWHPVLSASSGNGTGANASDGPDVAMVKKDVRDLFDRSANPLTMSLAPVHSTIYVSDPNHAACPARGTCGEPQLLLSHCAA